jgi:hypothetical protein
VFFNRLPMTEIKRKMHLISFSTVRVPLWAKEREVIEVILTLILLTVAFTIKPDAVVVTLDV